PSDHTIEVPKMPWSFFNAPRTLTTKRNKSHRHQAKQVFQVIAASTKKSRFL
ncbi:hypothetical protein ACLOJK_028603, partial [Asimina triloba]